MASIVSVISSAPASVADTEFMTIQPSAGQEWQIQNIYCAYGNKVELYRTDGTNDIKVDETTLGGFGGGFKYNLTNAHYLKVKNTSGGAIYMAYDGIRVA